MDKNTVLINTTERARLRDKYMTGIPDDVYDTLWALEVMQERVSYWEFASKIAAEFVENKAAQEFLNGHDSAARNYRLLASDLKKYMNTCENKPKYETYAMAERAE